jgi:hypothetical protein
MYKNDHDNTKTEEEEDWKEEEKHKKKQLSWEEKVKWMYELKRIFKKRIKYWKWSQNKALTSGSFEVTIASWEILKK